MKPGRLLLTGALVVSLVVAVAGLLRAAAPQGPATLEERAASVSAGIRCPTCQGLSIQDSPSVLAAGARLIVEQQLREGKDPQQIRAYFVDRYGPSALLSPDPAGPGLLAWSLPLLALPAGAWYAWRRLRRPAAPAAGPASDPDAAAAIEEFQAGRLQPDDSPAGEHLREALLVLRAARQDAVDRQAHLGAESRLGQAYRRYHRRPGISLAPARRLPRRMVTVGSLIVLAVGVSGALAVGVRERGADDLPTGDLPGATNASALGKLVAATRERPQDPAAWTALGRAQDQAGELAQAVAAYDQALSLDPEADGVALLRAVVLLRGGSPSEALPILTRLAQQYPDDPDAVLALGNAQDLLEMPQAETTLRSFLQLVAPDAPVAALVRQRLSELSEE